MKTLLNLALVIAILFLAYSFWTASVERQPTATAPAKQSGTSAAIPAPSAAPVTAKVPEATRTIVSTRNDGSIVATEVPVSVGAMQSAGFNAYAGAAAPTPRPTGAAGIRDSWGWSKSSTMDQPHR